MDEENTSQEEIEKARQAIIDLDIQLATKIREVLDKHGLNGAIVEVEVERNCHRGSTHAYYRVSTALTIR